jgi:hypothetical protein
MVSLAGTQLDYCVYQCFNPSMSALDIFTILNEVLIATATFFFNVIAIIGDGAQCNRQFQKRYFTYGEENNQHMIHPVWDEPIYFISDPSHVVKKIVSSTSSYNRKIFKSVNGIDRVVSLSAMYKLWESFNDNSGLNRFKSFKTIDFIKNSFQAMRVGPCIKVLGPKMLEVIDMALFYKNSYEEFLANTDNTSKLNPYEKYKDADKYLGWKEVAEKFSGLFSILNSTENRLNTTSYSSNLNYLREFYNWFKDWKDECVARRKLTLKDKHTAYDAMTGFFSAEASDDCLSMVQGIIALTTYYCNNKTNASRYFFFLPRRISQDLVENAFSRIRLAIGHGRLDHITTYNAIVEVSAIKETKASTRSMQKRNAAGATEEYKPDDVENCIEYASDCIKESLNRRHLYYNVDDPFKWSTLNGIKSFVKL